ncbi:MAG: outer membrane protein assembly factor BamE [Pseudomonadota bacterium]|nr:outer membrane protein assembly factor BamE [Pseudomonadota bacterium]
MMPAGFTTGKPTLQFRSRLTLNFSLLLSLATLGACGGIGFPGVYRINVEQGNIVDQEMVDQLKPQMTRRQVRFVLGTPIIEDTFNADRWDYVHVVRLGNENLSRSQLTVVFKGDVLVDVEGDLVSENWPEIDVETEGS